MKDNEARRTARVAKSAARNAERLQLLALDQARYADGKVEALTGALTPFVRAVGDAIEADGARINELQADVRLLTAAVANLIEELHPGEFGVRAPSEPIPPVEPDLDDLVSAIWIAAEEGWPLYIRYRDLEGETTWRVVSPWWVTDPRFARPPAEPYFGAWCHWRGKPRQFRVSGIEEIELAQTSYRAPD